MPPRFSLSGLLGGLVAVALLGCSGTGMQLVPVVVGSERFEGATCAVLPDPPPPLGPEVLNELIESGQAKLRAALRLPAQQLERWVSASGQTGASTKFETWFDAAATRQRSSWIEDYQSRYNASFEEQYLEMIADRFDCLPPPSDQRENALREIADLALRAAREVSLSLPELEAVSAPDSVSLAYEEIAELASGMVEDQERSGAWVPAADLKNHIEICGPVLDGAYRQAYQLSLLLTDSASLGRAFAGQPEAIASVVAANAYLGVREPSCETDMPSTDAYPGEDAALGAEEVAMEDGFPSLSVPLPRWSDHLHLTEGLFIRKGRRLRPAYEAMRRAVERAHLSATVYKFGHRGLAMITNIEQIDDRGVRIVNQYIRPDPLLLQKGLIERFLNMLKRRSGRFRMFVLLVGEPQWLRNSSHALSWKKAVDMPFGGGIVPADAFLDSQTVAGLHSAAVVYEFYKRNEHVEPELVGIRLPVREHLIRAGMFAGPDLDGGH